MMTMLWLRSYTKNQLYKKFLSCLLLIMSVMVLGGCGGGSSDKLDALQQANKELVKKYEKDIADLNVNHMVEIDTLQQANKELVKKYENDIADLNANHMVEKLQIKIRARAKTKVQRGISVIPVIGLASFAIFEKMEFEDWKKDHLNGTPNEYVREMSEASQELFKKEYHDFEKYAGEISKTSEEFLKKSEEFLKEKHSDFKEFYSKILN